MTEPWQERKRPARLERRYEFACYDQLRDFLDQAAEVSEEMGYYPDMAFGRKHVSVTITAEDGGELTDHLRLFAGRLDALGGFESFS
jgi:Pterin-4a-carbinolamine dehydratase